jgi:hypothetical protein
MGPHLVVCGCLQALKLLDGLSKALRRSTRRRCNPRLFVQYTSTYHSAFLGVIGRETLLLTEIEIRALKEETAQMGINEFIAKPLRPGPLYGAGLLLRLVSYVHGNKQKVMNVSAHEFVHRFHVLPQRTGPHPPLRALCQPQPQGCSRTLPLVVRISSRDCSGTKDRTAAAQKNRRPSLFICRALQRADA